MVLFLVASVMHHHKLGDIRSRNVFSLQSHEGLPTPTRQRGRTSLLFTGGFVR